MPQTVHIVGAGLAGLSTAVRTCARGVPTVVHEATELAGGRCRSYEDAATGLRIDNGTHILLSGNGAALRFVDRIGGAASLSGAAAARFPFIDLISGERWILDLGEGRLPAWIFDPKRRAPKTRAAEYLALLRILLPAAGRPLGNMIACKGPAYDRVVRPFLLATLNAEPSAASFDLARAVVLETIAAGGRACRPYLAPKGLSAAFVEPAIAFIERHAGSIRYSHELRRLVVEDNGVSGLEFGDGVVAIGPEDTVVLAVPPYAAASILPGLTTPNEYSAIINAHFRVSPPPALAPMTGVINGVAEWVFAFDDRICVTISGADRLLRHRREEIAEMIWCDVRRMADVPVELPPWQIVRERRATFAPTPVQNARRPGPQTAWRNLVLAGDWTNTGLPATIESAVRSGNRAADFVMRR